LVAVALKINRTRPLFDVFDGTKRVFESRQSFAMKKSSIPANGSVFLVPLPAAGFGIGVLVRGDGKGRAYGAFFGPRVSRADEVDMANLRQQDAILRCRFGDYGLHTRRWIVIGSIPNWGAGQWQIPRFSRPHDNSGMRYVTEYDDDLNLMSEVVTPVAETTDMPEDAQFGSGIVEVKLNKLLQN
jgi:hypothetical protein